MWVREGVEMTGQQIEGLVSVHGSFFIVSLFSFSSFSSFSFPSFSTSLTIPPAASKKPTSPRTS